MQVTSEKFSAYTSSQPRPPRAESTAQEPEPTLPTDEVTFGGGSSSTQLAGLAVLTTGMILGSQMTGGAAPLVMMGSLLGGIAIIMGS